MASGANALVWMGSTLSPADEPKDTGPFIIHTTIPKSLLMVQGHWLDGGVEPIGGALTFG